MNAEDIQAIIEAEIAGDWSRSNAHNVDLRQCLVPPRKVACHNAVFANKDDQRINLWLVLEECPGSADGYLIVFNEARRMFGLAYADAEAPSFIGYYGTFLETLRGM